MGAVVVDVLPLAEKSWRISEKNHWMPLEHGPLLEFGGESLDKKYVTVIFVLEPQ